MVYVQRPSLTFVAGCRTPCSMAVVPRTPIVLATVPTGGNAFIVRVPEEGAAYNVPSPISIPGLRPVYGRDWGRVGPVRVIERGNGDLVVPAVIISALTTTSTTITWLLSVRPFTCLVYCSPSSPSPDPIAWSWAFTLSAVSGPIVAGIIIAVRPSDTARARRATPSINPVITAGYQGLTVAGQF